MDFFNDLQDYFSTLSSQEMLFFWLVAALLFVIGLLIGILIQSSRLKRYRAQYLITDKERANFQARALSAEGKLGALEKEVAALSREKVAVIEELEELKKRPTAGNDPTELEELREEVQLLRSENDRLTVAQENVQVGSPGVVVGTNSGGNPMISDPALKSSDVQDYLTAAEARFQAFEQRLQELSAENDRLNTQVNQLQGGSDRSLGAPYGTPHQPIIGTAVEEDDQEPLVIRADITDPGARTDNDGGMEVIVDNRPGIVVPVLPPENVEPDDLKLINNIGPFLEKKLNEQGIYTYAQMAAWSAEDIDKVTESIGYVPGVISKDDWVGQAKQLQKDPPPKPKEDVATTMTKAVDVPLVKPGNLRIIEGVGPKIESILKEAGLKTLEDIGNKSADELRIILAAAGNRFKAHNPDTWPAQARLAANGELEALRQLQEDI